MPIITWNDFEKVEIRVGTVTKVEEFPEAKIPAYKVWVDLGEYGVKKSSARITKHYQRAELVGRQVVCVTNFAPKQIGPFVSEILIAGFYDPNGEVILAVPDKPVPNGAKLA